MMIEHNHKKSLEEMRDNIQKQIVYLQDKLAKVNALLDDSPDNTIPIDLTGSVTGSNTISGRIIDASIELIKLKNRQVTPMEIMEFINQKGLSLGKSSNKQAYLGAVLSSEVRKKNGARLKKVGHGRFDIK